METYNKKYKIVAPDGYVEEWSQADFEKGGAALMSDNPDVKVYSQESYDPTQQYGANVAYGIEDEDGYFESWTADEWSKGKDALLKDHPNLKIYVLGDASQDYHRQKAEKQRQAITDFDAANKDFIRAHELDSLIMSEGGAVSADYDANDKKYNDLLAERKQLVSNYATNPANKQDWSASAQYADQIASNYESKLKGMRDATRFSNAATSMYSGNIRENNDYVLYEQARKLAKDAAKAYAAPSYGEHTGFGGYVKDMGTGAGKVFSDVDFWSRGLSAIDRDKNVRKIVNSLSEKGINVLEATEKELYDNLSPAQIALISSFLLDAQAQYERSLDTARGYNAGVTFAESIGYMAEFLATGGIARAVGSAGKAASSGFGKLLANELSKGSEAAIKSKVSRGLINAFTKGGTKSLSKSAKAATDIASKAAGKAYSYGIRPAESAIWHTALQPSTYRTISENLTQINDNGDLVKAGSAIWGGVLDQLIENWSESMGGAVEDILGLPLKGVGAAGEKILGKTTLGQWGKWLADSASAKVLHEAGFNGLIGEMGEEWLGNAARVGLGLMTKDEFKDFASFESQVDMAASFAPMTLFGLGTSSYAAAKQDKNYRKLAKDMRGVLNRAGWSEEDVADVMDVKHTKEEIARTLAPVLQSIVRNSQDGKVAQEDYITTLKFAQAAAIQEVLSSAQTIEQERARKEMQEEIAQNLGAVPQEFKNEDGTTVIYPTDNRGNFSYTQVAQTPSGNYGVNVVTTAKDAKGEYFVIPDDDSDTMLLKNRNDANATPRFISRQEFQEQVDAGLMTTETSTLENYLDARIEEKREMQRKYAENAQLEDKYQQVAQKMQVGSKINAGTEDAPMEGVVLAVDRGGVTVDFGQPVLLNGRNMQIHKLSLEQAGNFVGIDARIESEQRSVEEQVEQDEINSATVKAYNQSLAGEQFTVDGHLYTYVHMFEMPQLDDDGIEIAHIVATDEQGRDVEMDIPLEDIKTRETDAAVKTNEQVEEVKDDNVLRDIHGNPIPMRVNEKTQQEEVDKRTFKNKDPEAYYAWNDAQRGGNTEDSMQAITADIASETAQLTALQKQLTVETDPDMRDELHESVNKTQNRINLLEGIYHKYDAENNFQDEQLDFARRIYDVQSKLINAKTQEQVDALIKIKADLFRQYQLATVDSAENVMLAKRAVELQQEINSVADVPVQVVFESNIEAVMRTDGASEASINRVLSKVAELRSARITSGKNLVMTGLYNEGKVYIFAEGNTDASSALLTYYHERQHMRTAEDPEAMNKVLVLARNERDNLMQVLSLLTDNIAPYQGANNQELADEIVASAMEKACTDEKYEQTLRSRGLSEELINIIKTEYAKQRRITDSDAVRQEDWNANVRTSDTGNGQQDGAVEQGASGNGQLGTAQLSTDTAAAAEQRPGQQSEQQSKQGSPEEQAPDAVSGDAGSGAEEINQVRAIEEQRKVVDTEPTEAQKEAGNYRMGHVRIDGLDITIENPRGSIRKGTDADGHEWQTEMHNDYGYIRGTKAVDDDHLDVFLSDNPTRGKVYVIDQVDPKTGEFDESKVMYGFDSEQDAREAYLSNYEDGWQGLGKVTEVSKEEFKKWIDSSTRKTKPFSEYASVKAAEDKKENTTDNQGNPVNDDGTLKVEKIESVDDLTDEDFSSPTRSVQLPKLPDNVDAAIGANGKPIIIKKNIFERNSTTHHEVSPQQAREILTAALYRPDLYGQNQKATRPYNWIVINTKDNEGQNKLVVLEVNDNKDNVEIVHWYVVDNRGVEKVKRQAAREGGHILILPSEMEEAGALSGRPSDLSSDGKFTQSSETKQVSKGESGAPRIKKVNLFDFVDKDKYSQRPILKGIYHDKGMLVASDAALLLAIKDNYSDELEGAVTFKEGHVTENVKYPDWRNIIFNKEWTGEQTKVDISLDNLALYLEQIKTNVPKKILTDEDRRASFVVINFGDGNSSAYDYKRLVKFVNAARFLNAQVSYCSSEGKYRNSPDKKLIAEGENGMVALFPINFSRESDYNFNYNVPLNEAEDSRFRIVESTDEEILSDSNKKDSEYFAAIERGDMEEAQRIVNEFAQKAGYTTISDYQGTSAFNGAAPYGNPYFLTKEERKDAWDNDEFEGDQTLGDYIERGIDANNLDFIALDPRNYRAANSMRKEAIDNVRNAIQKRSKTITMFRSVPSEIKEGSFRNGDWVTPSRAYAVDNAKIHGWGDNYNIIKQTVSVDEIWWDGNDIAEWGYGREEDYVNDTDFAYKNTKNNRKLLDVITRDDKGNIIPPSRRFDSGNADERYHISGRKAIDKSSEESRIAYEAVKEQLDRIGIPVELLSDQAMREMAINANALETVSSQDEYQQTVVSSASGAKVINNLDNLAKSLENEPKTKEKTFLGALAKALDAKKHGSNSQYATFEAKNGTVVTIRLANHNVTTSTFDNHGENDGISIVVSARKNNGIINDGKAHVTEFYYDAIKLRKADGKPLVDIVKSVKQSLYSGEYKDTTGLAQREEVNAKDVPEFMTVYHGSGAKFDKFDHSHMGEGEGVQAYGWGTYVTEVEGIGRTYAKAMAAKNDGALPKRNLYTVEIPEDINSALSKDEILKGLDSLGKELFSGYGLNDVQINAVFGTTREWYKFGYTATSDYFPLKEAFKAYGIDAETIDKRIHDEAMEDRRKNPAGYGFYLNWAGRIDMWIEKLGISEDEYERYDMATGRDAYRYLESKLGGAKEASDYLSDHGYVGISYPAQYRSGGRSDGARNYVIFNENNAKIVDRIEFLREPDGTVYGATVGGKIYLNRERLNPNTPIHEYTHLWFSALKDANPELYKRGVELMKQLPIWEEVRTDSNYANLSGDDAIASECLSRLVGDKGADALTKMAKDANVRGDIIGTANRISLIEKFKDWLKKFWTWVRDSFTPWTKEEAARVSVDDIQNMVLSDLAKGVNPLANAREESEMKKTNDKFNDDDFEYLIKRNPGSFDAPENGIRFRIVTEPKLIEQLNLEPTVKVFRAMQIVDGELFPPMSITVNGKKREPSKIGQWEQSEENPELADEDGYFKLNKGKNDKGENKSLKAKYNPYFHTSLFPLNDQFSEAQTRSNIVIVEGRVPKSELTSGYRAEKAKDPVGKMTWHSGPVAGILGQYEGKEREVILSRWFKPERIVPYDQIADISVQMFKGTSLEKNPLPSNVFHPDLRNELEKRGVSFVETNNRGQLLDDAKGRTWSSLYGKEAAGKKARVEAKEQDVVDMFYDADELPKNDEIFNMELENFKDNKHKGLLHLGKPLGILKASGINAEEMTISPSVLHRHLKKHGLTTDDLKGLARSIQSPILVYKHGKNSPNIVAITELDVKGGKLSASFELDSNGRVVDVSNISSVHSKEAKIELERLYKMGESDFRNALRWVEKGKVLNWLAPSSYKLSGMQAGEAPFDIANIVKSFENPRVSFENIANEGDMLPDGTRFRIVGGNSGYEGYSMSKRAAEAKEEGRFPKTQFVKEYGVPAAHLDALVVAGIISNDEWHHTSKFGNKTPFYGWVEDSFLQAYNDNKAAIEEIIEQYNGTDPLSFTERRKLAEKIAAIIESSESVVSAREPAEALIAQREAEKAHRRDVMSEMANSEGKIKKSGNEYWYNADNQVSLHMHDNGRIIDIEFPIGTKTQSQRDELYKAAQKEFREAYERAEKILQDKANENSEGQKPAPDVESSESRFRAVKSYDGLQSFGQDKLFDIMHKTFADLPESTRTKITKLAPAHGYKFHEATADYFASLATKKDLSEEEKMDVMVVRDNIKAALDIDYLSCSEALWALYNTVNKNSKDILSIARRTLVADKLGFMPEDRSKRDDVKDGVRFSIRENSHDASAAEIYNKATSYWYNRLRESYVDMNESVNDLVAAIESTTKQPAQAFEDVRLAINRQSSKGLNQMTKFMSDYLEPMWGAVGKVMEATGMTYDEVVRYVMLKHAVERNDVFARRDARRFYERKCDSIISKLKDEKKQKENMRKRAMANAEISIAYALDQEIQNIDKQIDSALKSLDRQLVKVDNGTSTKYKELREQDYGGLTSMYSKYPGLGARSDYATDEEYNKAARKVRVPMYDNVSDMENAARSEVNAFENRTSGDEFNELWRRINAATKKTLESQYDNNIISREQYNAARDQFKYYVPLRGFKDTEAEDIWTYMDVSLSGSFAPALKNAKGRKSEAENPFNWIGTMASSAIAQNVKNEAKLALYYFIANRPNQDLVTIGKVWYQYDAAATAAHAAANPGDTKKIFTPVYPPVTTGLDSNAAKDAYDTWEADMRAKAAAGEAYLRTNKLNVQDDVAFISNKQVPQHVIKLKVRGEEMNLYINGDPRAAQAINGMLNIETNGGYQKVFGPILRWMSAVNTSYNPEFWISNLQRDFLFALMSSSITGEGANNLLKGFVNPKKIVQMMRDYEAGKLGNSREENYYREFAEGGGITGFTVIVGNEVWEKKIQEYLNPSDFAKISKSIKFDKFLKFFNDLGEAIEQMSRFAAFIGARETGKSIEEAVAASKEITVNFNRKGSGKAVDWADLDKLTTADGAKLNKAQKLAVFTASFIPAYGRRFIMFFNAAVQGANAMYKLWKKDHRKTLAWASGYFAISVLQAVLHALADDDDDYLDIPDYTRRSNLLLGGGGIYFKWALPQEMRPFYAWGDIFVNQVMGREPNKNMLLEMANSAADILPLGPGGVLPSVIQPSWDLYTNKDFTGSRIYNDNKYLSDAEREARPNYKDPRPQTNKLFIDISQVLNALSGGDEYSAGAVNVHPESMQHVVESLGGGLLTTMNKTEETVAGALGAIIGEDMIDQDLSVRRFPFLNRVLMVNDERTRNSHVSDLYYYYKDMSDVVEDKMRRMKKEMNYDALEKLQNSPEHEVYQIVKSYKKMMQRYDDDLKAEEDRNERKNIMREQDELRKEMINEISQTR